MGTTGQPAVVYIPSGTYLMEGSIQLYVGTVIVGDPLNPPILKASSNFPNDHIIYGKDPNHDGTINFYMAFKNIIIDFITDLSVINNISGGCKGLRSKADAII